MYGVDIEYIVIGLGAVSALLLLLIIILFIKLSKMTKKYNAFMAGEDGKSMEEQVYENYNLMKKIELKEQQQELDLMDISDRVDDCMSRVNIVKYDAFHNVGGKLSFVLTVLNDKKNGYIINCMHSNSGSYLYSREVKQGKCDVELSKEEQESLNGAL